MSFFQFDSQFKNKVPFGRERFLQFAQQNLTPKEYLALEQQLTDYQIEYILTCQNGDQLALVNATILSPGSKNFEAASQALLACLPRENMLFLHSNDVGKIYAAKRKLQKKNAGRAYILSKCSSYSFSVENPDKNVIIFLKKIENSSASKASADEVVSFWTEAVRDMNTEHRREFYGKCNYSHLIIPDMYMVEHEDQRTYFELKEELVEELCSVVYYLWCVYLEQTELVKISVEPWINCFLETANEYVRDTAYIGLNDNDVRQIVDAFETAYLNDEEFSPTSVENIDPEDFLLQMYTLQPGLWEKR